MRGLPILAVVAVLLLLPAGNGAAAEPQVTAPFGVAKLTVVGTGPTALGPGFWGVDVRPTYHVGMAEASEFNNTSLHYVRWPGGAVADGYNISANRIYDDAGGSTSPPSNVSEFAHWCRSVSCKAIVQLPAEIDQPATAAYYVRYIETTVAFHPAYWEIGNEPARWTHLGLPWSQWNRSQSQNATPGTYAQVVQGYASSIRAVDPKAAIIGLAGVGTGGYNEATWIDATVRLNGPNISAVAIHVYPAGGSNGTPGARGFLATLDGHGSLAYRVPVDRSAILSACPRCHPIALFVTELGTGTQGGPYDALMGSFVGVPYLAAELVQAMTAHVANVDLFAFQSTYNGSLLTSSGGRSRVFTLYAELHSALGPLVENTSVSSNVTGLYAVATTTGLGSPSTLLFVNANSSRSVRFQLLGSGFPSVGSGSAWRWDPSSVQPVVTVWSLVPPVFWLLPARSILVLQIV